MTVARVHHSPRRVCQACAARDHGAGDAAPGGYGLTARLVRCCITCAPGNSKPLAWTGPRCRVSWLGNRGRPLHYSPSIWSGSFPLVHTPAPENIAPPFQLPDKRRSRGFPRIRLTQCRFCCLLQTCKIRGQRLQIDLEFSGFRRACHVDARPIQVPVDIPGTSRREVVRVLWRNARFVGRIADPTVAVVVVAILAVAQLAWQERSQVVVSCGKRVTIVCVETIKIDTELGEVCQ
jgi:hypothetical protein